jgi:hypothetical protein
MFITYKVRYQVKSFKLLIILNITYVFCLPALAWIFGEVLKSPIIMRLRDEEKKKRMNDIEIQQQDTTKHTDNYSAQG